MSSFAADERRRSREEAEFDDYVDFCERIGIDPDDDEAYEAWQADMTAQFLEAHAERLIDNELTWDGRKP